MGENDQLSSEIKTKQKENVEGSKVQTLQEALKSNIKGSIQSPKSTDRSKSNSDSSKDIEKSPSDVSMEVINETGSKISDSKSSSDPETFDSQKAAVVNPKVTSL